MVTYMRRSSGFNFVTWDRVWIELWLDFWKRRFRFGDFRLCPACRGLSGSQTPDCPVVGSQQQQLLPARDKHHTQGRQQQVRAWSISISRQRLAAASCRQHQPLDCCLFAVCLVLIQSKWFSAEVGIVPMPRRTTKLGLTDQETGKACCNPISSENMSSVGFRIVHLSSHKFIASLGCTDSGESAQQVSEQLRNRRIWVWNKHKSTKGSNIRTAVNRQRKTRVSYRKTEPDLE